MLFSRCIDELDTDPDTLAGLADAPLHHVPNAEIACYLLHWDGLALVDEGGVSCDHRESSEDRQPGDQILRNAISKVVLVRVSAEVVKRQHSHRRGRPRMS